MADNLTNAEKRRDRLRRLEAELEDKRDSPTFIDRCKRIEDELAELRKAEVSGPPT
jgi:hypothetical protein